MSNAIYVLAVLLISNADGTIHFSLYSNTTGNVYIENNMDSFAASFGPMVDQLGYTGQLIVASPLNPNCTECSDFGCTALSPPKPSQSPAIALIQRSSPFDESHPTNVHCTFEWKVRNAMNAGFGAVIIYNIPNDQDLEEMQASNSSDINISSVFIGGADGSYLRRKLETLEGFATLYPDPIFHNFLITFVIVVSSSSIIFTIFLFYRRHMIMSRNVTAKKMTKRQVMKLPRRIFQPEDADETCVICLDSFSSSDHIIILPCNHFFHKKCIIPWLSEQQRVCPICKRDPLVTESTPLLSTADEEVATPIFDVDGANIESQTANTSDNDSESAADDESFVSAPSSENEHSECEENDTTLLIN